LAYRPVRKYARGGGVASSRLEGDRPVSVASLLPYFQDLRVEYAQSLLHGGGPDLDAIATEVGYIDGATLRTLSRERLGRGVRDLRAELRC
jgi:AraC-like DNA-binding protein